MVNPQSSDQTGTIQQFYEAVLRSDSYTAKQLTAFQDNVLKDLLPFVASNVPFYRDTLKPVFHQDGRYRPEGWTELPIISSKDVRVNPEAFRPLEIPASHGRAARYMSSGSSGKPMAFHRSALSEAGQNAAHYRQCSQFKLDTTRNLAMIRAFDYSVSRTRSLAGDPANPSWAAEWFTGAAPGMIESLTVFTPIAEQVAWLQARGEVYLNTFPSNALALARYVAQHPETKPSLLAILTVGEPLTNEVRRQCAEHLGCRCIDILSSAEVGIIASDCPQGDVLHVASELCRVEILDKSNKPAKLGAWGRLIVTPLYNFAMPLIRYDTGDLVRLAPPCQCGRSHAAIDRSIGRPSNLFLNEKKQWFRPDLPSSEIENLLGGCRWQLAQIGAKDFELRYMSKLASSVPNQLQMKARFSKILGRQVSVRLKPVPALGLSPSGKFLSVQNDLAMPGSNSRD